VILPRRAVGVNFRQLQISPGLAVPGGALFR